MRHVAHCRRRVPWRERGERRLPFVLEPRMSAWAGRRAARAARRAPRNGCVDGGLSRPYTRAPQCRHAAWTRPTQTDCDMANSASAKKTIRKIQRRTVVNRARRSRMRSFLRQVEDAIASGDAEAAKAALAAAEPEVMRAVSRGVLHKNTGARKISRLSRRVRSLSA